MLNSTTAGTAYLWIANNVGLFISKVVEISYVAAAEESILMDDYYDENITSTTALVTRFSRRFKTPQEFSTEYKIVATVLHLIILCVGLCGNTLLILVVRRAKSLQTPTYCYLVSLAIADLVVLISAVPEAIISYHLYSKQWILGQVGCSLLIFANFLGINAGSLSILAFSVERYIAVCHTMLAQQICTIKRASKIIIGVWITCILYCAQWLGLTKTRAYPGYPEFEICDFRLSRELYVYVFSTDLIMFYVVPLIVSAALYMKIAIVLYERTRNAQLESLSRRTGRNGKRESTISLYSSAGSFIIRRNSKQQNTGAGGRNKMRRNSYESHVQTVKMLVVVVALFALSWLPFRGLLVYNTFAAKPWLNIWYMLFAKTAIYFNCSINPFLYNAMSRRFRIAFRNILPCQPEHMGLTRQMPYQKRPCGIKLKDFKSTEPSFQSI